MGYPGGFLHPWEHAAHGAIREVAEETGLQVRLTELLSQELAFPHCGQVLATWKASSRQHGDAQASWMPRERWQALVRGEDCPLCAELAAPDRANPHGFPVAELGISRLRLAANQAVPGYCILICRRHVREPYELPLDEQVHYWQDLMRAGRAIDKVFEPVKLNFQILGNLVPHLHTHLVPRFYGDSAPARPLDPSRATRLASPAAAAAVVQRLRADLEPL